MKRTSRKEMEAVVASFKSSGLTQREFCDQQNIKLPTFSYWYRKESKTVDNRIVSGIPFGNSSFGAYYA